MSKYFLVQDGEVAELVEGERVDASYPSDNYGSDYLVVKAPDAVLALRVAQAYDADRDMPQDCKVRGCTALDAAHGGWVLTGDWDAAAQ